jgi:transcriptional regulator with XRE-family HTH domain
MFMSQNTAVLIRQKKLGILLRDARLAAGKTMKETGQVIGVSGSSISSIERGKKSPSLPELEILAYFLDTPIERFWSDELVSTEPHPTENLNVEQLLTIRDRIIGALLKQKRQEADLSLNDLAEQTGISASSISRYEKGARSIPIPELELLGRALNYPIQQFTNHKGPVGEWISQQRAIAAFLELPPNLVDFVSKPINRPYLELAQRLSEMEVGKLREVAEGLLEITL